MSDRINTGTTPEPDVRLPVRKAKGTSAADRRRDGEARRRTPPEPETSVRAAINDTEMKK
ncbi:MAG: hypothetical protein EOP28_03925 [Rhodococcus sp. (in: high G+C Gram-positive bacteria)]|nr:MAG: hypothetical protein EOP28_03925 [Rhodococcus sp. (in: high G+C Gram-positive bacteria)]